VILSISDIPAITLLIPIHITLYTCSIRIFIAVHPRINEFSYTIILIVSTKDVLRKFTVGQVV
jgi:hypothetical protein